MEATENDEIHKIGAKNLAALGRPAAVRADGSARLSAGVPHQPGGGQMCIRDRSMSVLRAVSMMMGTLEKVRICMHASSPSSLGIIRSKITRSGFSELVSATALSPSKAVTTSYPSCSRLNLMP